MDSGRMHHHAYRCWKMNSLMKYIVNQKILKFFVAAFAVVAALCACKKSNTYADYVEDEDEKIDNFISSKKIKVVTEMPEKMEDWMDGEYTVYYLYTSGKADGLYFHLDSLGSGDEVPEANWTAYVRYRGYDLLGTLWYSCWNDVSPDPVSFVIQKDAGGSTYGRGFQQAVKNLRVGGACKVIIPFSIANQTLATVAGGVRSDYSLYQPAYYEIKLEQLR